MSAFHPFQTLATASPVRRERASNNLEGPVELRRPFLVQVFAKRMPEEREDVTKIVTGLIVPSIWNTLRLDREKVPDVRSYFGFCDFHRIGRGDNAALFFEFT